MKKPSLSIAICSYNPDHRLLKRLLDAVARMNGVDLVESILIVDNSSDVPLSSFYYVENFLNSFSHANIVREERAGLSHARVRAIEETISDILVFFDDDNEPSPGYICEVQDAFERYPSSGVWGPGSIDVEFVDGYSEDVLQYSSFFQQRSSQFGYLCTPAMADSPYFPYGTGFAIRREVLRAYAKAFKSERLCVLDRCGSSLSSAGDVQIIWEAFKLGLSAGVLPQLRCDHLISKKKANLRYVKRLVYGTASSYLPALIQSYPEAEASIGHPTSSSLLLMFRLAKQMFLAYTKSLLFPGSSASCQIKLASHLGEIYGLMVAKNDMRAKHVHKFSGMLGLT
jgi:glycosyltransferase involved in cell wall biosynthesis